MRTDTDRGRERVALEIVRRRRRCRTAVAAIGGDADLDDAVDVRGGRRMTRAAITAHVDRGRRRRTVTARAVARRRWIVPPRLRRGATRGVQHRAVAINVAAGLAVERWGSVAIRRIEGLGCACAEHHGHRPGDRDAVVQDVTVVVPVLRCDVALATRDRRRMSLMCERRRSRRPVTGRARGRPVDVTLQTRHADPPTFEVTAVARRAERKVPVATLELVTVKRRARRIEKSDRMDLRRRAIRRARRPQHALVRATGDEQEHEHAFQGSP